MQKKSIHITILSPPTIDSIISVTAGSRIPLDGEVLDGKSYVNQAPITGESMPVAKAAGDTVYAGTVNGDGSLSVRVTKVHSDTMLSRMLYLIEEAQTQKAPAQQFVDRFAAYYTPAVIIVALLIFTVPPLLGGALWSVWFYRALVLLVIACPCALVIATPVGIISGLTTLARRGILVKGGSSLESVAGIRALVWYRIPSQLSCLLWFLPCALQRRLCSAYVCDVAGLRLPFHLLLFRD